MEFEIMEFLAGEEKEEEKKRERGRRRKKVYRPLVVAGGCCCCCCSQKVTLFGVFGSRAVLATLFDYGRPFSIFFVRGSMIM